MVWNDLKRMSDEIKHGEAVEIYNFAQSKTLKLEGQ